MRENGFTLIELVVAIAILGIVMLISIPAVNYIRKDNNDTKYKSYEKAIDSAAKLYVDSYDEDLFGITNTGCALITYEALKNKGLIEDIQVKNVDCGQEDTFVFVRKNKLGNHHYDTYITCRDDSKIIYGTGKKPSEMELCGLEDNSGPLVKIIKDPDKPTYYIGDKPQVTINLSDVGVGLKENQVLKYRWYKGANPFGEEKTLEFENDNYVGSISKKVDVPSNLESINESTNYFIRVTGIVYDVDNNFRPINMSEPFNYFVGALLIQMMANNGVMADPHGADYSIKSGYIVRGENDKIISKIKYKETNDLWDYNNKNYINIKRNHYHIVSGKEWIFNTTSLNQATKYSVAKFGYSNSDLKTKNITVTVKANWVIDSHTLTYNNNGGSGCTIKKADYGTTWGTLCTPIRTGYKFLGWKDGNTTVTENTEVTGDRKVTASWKQVKPNTPTITNPTNGSWTKNNFSLSLKTTTLANEIGKWYYTYDKNEFFRFKDNYGVLVTKKNSFKTYPFSAERNDSVFVRVCNTYATSATDPDNCSNYASTKIRIDKTPPKYVSKRLSHNSERNFWYMTWKDSGSGLSVVNSGNKSKVYYCYGATDRCDRFCATYKHDHNDDYKGTIDSLNGIWLREAVIKANFASGSNDGELEFKTYRDCQKGKYLVKAESIICDKVSNCTKKYVSWDFR